LAVSSGVADRIIWLGPVYSEDELAPWFLSADLFLHPAAIGLSLLHAMGYGLPVVTQDDASGHMPEFAAFRNGETGLLYASGDMSDFCNKVRTLIADHHERCRMGSNAEHIARTLYNKDVMVDRFNLMITKAIRGDTSL
jgi:glycosyltransferase involved in cell wall biosynthesis